MPAGELHLQLSVNFPDNRKVRALVRYGRDARAIRDLYVQMCLYCKGTLSDGFVPDEQIGLLVYPDTEKNGKRDAARLAEVGLLERGVNGWLVTGWFDRNNSREEVRQKSAAKARGAKLANHRRWHVEYGNTDPKCEWCKADSQKPDQTTDQNTDKTSDQSSDPGHDTKRVGGAKRSDSTETESETESEKEVKALDRPRPAERIQPGSDDDPDFAAFWSAYPRKEAKGQARTAWRTAVIRKKIDPKTIILGAERYADDPKRKAGGRTYTAHPATWLNGERWLEQLDDTRGDDVPDDDDEDFWTALWKPTRCARSCCRSSRASASPAARGWPAAPRTMTARPACR